MEVEAAAVAAEKVSILQCQKNEQFVNARAPLKLINGSMPAGSNVQPNMARDGGAQHVRILTDNGLKLFEFPKKHPGQFQPSLVFQGSVSSQAGGEPSLDLRLGNSDPSNNVRLTMQPGNPGFCLDVGPQRQKSSRRPKRPTVIIRPKPAEVKSVKEAEPCGVLGELKPGIIGRMRDTQHIQSILGAVAGVTTSMKRAPEPLTAEPRDKPAKQVKHEDPDTLSLEAVFKSQIREQEDTVDSRASAAAKFVADSAQPYMDEVSCQTTFDDSQVKVEKESLEDLEGLNHANGPAAQYFELISLDIKGRIAALKRSRRRVRTAIVAKDDTLCMTANNLNEASVPSYHKDPEKLRRQFELQMDRWKALFVSMDACLGVEAANLENHWKRVQSMQNELHASGSSSLECLCFSP